MRGRGPGDQPLLTLQALAKLAGANPQKIRRYEVEGLVVAETEIRRGGRPERLYASTTIRRIRRIRTFEEMGVNLAGIDIILRLLDQREAGRR